MRDSEYDDLDREMKERRDEGHALKAQLKSTKKELRQTSKQLRQTQQDMSDGGGRRDSHTSSMNGDTNLSQSSQKAKLNLIDILQSSANNVQR